MTVDVIMVDPDNIIVSKANGSGCPRIQFSEDFRILLKDWSQLEQLRDDITAALDTYYNSELKDEEALR